MTYSVIFTLLFSFLQQTDVLLGEWNLKSYDVIEKIKSSPAYLFGDDNARNAIDKQFNEILKNGKYVFKKDTLIYTDLVGDKIVYRTAKWYVKDQVLFIDEIDRSYKRQAFVHLSSPDSLIFSPIIDGKVGDSKMIFVRSKK